MVVIEGDVVGQIVLCGVGVGEGLIVSVVMVDICDIVCGYCILIFGQFVSMFKVIKLVCVLVIVFYYLCL